MNANDDATSLAVLEGSWVLESIDGFELPENLPRRPAVVVTADGSVQGSTGVNRFRGALDNDGNRLFGPLASTRRAGPPKAMALEAAFLYALNVAIAVEARDNRVILSGAEGQRLTLDRSGPDA